MTYIDKIELLLLRGHQQMERGFVREFVALDCLTRVRSLLTEHPYIMPCARKSFDELAEKVRAFFAAPPPLVKHGLIKASCAADRSLIAEASTLETRIIDDESTEEEEDRYMAIVEQMSECGWVV